MYENESLECAYCTEPCEECTAAGFCTKCTGDRVLNEATGVCDCPVGKFETGAEYCSECSVKCLNCEDFATNCIDCSHETRDPPELCPCIDGYFDVGTDACEECSLPCETCVNDPDYCIVCADGYENPPTCTWIDVAQSAKVENVPVGSAKVTVCNE